jgi:hypothetical protein
LEERHDRVEVGKPKRRVAMPHSSRITMVAVSMTAFCGVTASSSADFGRNPLVNQPHDFRAFSPSEQDTAVPFARTADDFINFNPKLFLDTIIIRMIITFPNSPADYGLEMYGGDDAPEGDPITFPLLSVTDLGTWNGQDDLHLIRLIFDGMDTFPGGGRLWLSPFAIGNGSGTDRGWWGTAGNGEVNGLEGQFNSEHFGVPDWTPISESGILDFPTDFAMRINVTFVPAPGALLLIAMGGLAARSRRRG